MTVLGYLSLVNFCTWKEKWIRCAQNTCTQHTHWRQILKLYKTWAVAWCMSHKAAHRNIRIHYGIITPIHMMHDRTYTFIMKETTVDLNLRKVCTSRLIMSHWSILDNELVGGWIDPLWFSKAFYCILGEENCLYIV